ncbi:MAG TPA: hypothetical protein VFI42_16140 [Thermomicrobiaceae bacterium]|nr:hypothetical protein [Thermomicrobiaceae bacterium]
MFDLTDLNLRYRAHAERVERANCFPVHGPDELRGVGSPRVVAAGLLLRLSAWLAPEQARRVDRAEGAPA